jgi:hypothetical protein
MIGGQESDQRAIENRIEQYRSLIRNTVDERMKVDLRRKLDAEATMLERLVKRQQQVARNGYRVKRDADK